MNSCERRKSRRHSTETVPFSVTLNSQLNHSVKLNSENDILNSNFPDDDDESSSSQSSQGLGEVQLNGNYKENNGKPIFLTY